VLRTMLREPRHEQRFLRLLAQLLQAGYVEAWRFHATRSGVPQGGVVSPILSHLSLDRLDPCVATVLLPPSPRGQRRRPSPPSMAVRNAARKQRLAGEREAATRVRHQAHHQPARDPNDPHLRRVWSVRSADAWLRGFSGPREEAAAINGQRKVFLRDTRTLTLAEEQTLITQARTASARFLGYEVVTQQADDQHCRAQHRRCSNGALGLKIPVEVIRTPCASYLRHGTPTHVAARLHATAYSLVTPYQAAYRGVVPYSLMALNVHRLWQVHRVRHLARAQTLAKQHRTSVKTMFHTQQATVATPHGPLRVREGQHKRAEGTPPLSARCGGIALRWHRHGPRHEKPKEVYGHRSAVVPRLLAQTCALCGAQAPCDVHHIRRLADLHKPGRQEKPLGVQRLAAYRRKTLVTCRTCHAALHRERPGQRHVPIEVTGKLLEIERLTSSLEGGRWQRAARHLAGGLPYRMHGSKRVATRSRTRSCYDFDSKDIT
jgi:hypothetical protein